MSIWSALWAGLNAATKTYKGTDTPVVTASTNATVAALANDATLVQGILTLIIQEVPAAALVEGPLNDIIHALLQALVNHLATGVATGADVPDGHGGIVPSTNSHFNEKTGAFE